MDGEVRDADLKPKLTCETRGFYSTARWNYRIKDTHQARKPGMNFFKRISTKSKQIYAELRKKKKRYWLTVLLLLIAGTVAGELLGEQYVWIRLRYRIYPVLQWVSLAPKGERKTVLVLINDDDYWKGELARRTPLKRDYLARL